MKGYKMYNYLIIGNGIAGLSCAEEIRKNDQAGSILIVSSEKVKTYWRTRLSELIAKDFSLDDILVKSEAWYKDKNIEEELDTTVENIDLASKKAKLSNGKEIEFEKVLIATGAHPFVPPIKNIDSEGVFAIRSADDLINFKAYVKEKNNLVIIGGGILGLEAAFAAKEFGLDVSVVESFDYLLSRQLDRQLSEKLEKALNEIGIKTFTGKNTDEIISKDGKVAGIKLSDGSEIPADAVMVQAGVRSNLKLAQDSNIKTDRGVCVGEDLRSEEDDFVYAAGDVAQIGNFTIGLWTASQEMGKIAGANMTGDSKTYEKPKPFSTLMLGDIKLFSAGMNSGEGVEEMKVEKEDKIYKLFKKDGQFVGGILWKDIKFQTDVKKIVFEGVDPKETKLGEEIFGL